MGDTSRVSVAGGGLRDSPEVPQLLKADTQCSHRGPAGAPRPRGRAASSGGLVGKWSVVWSVIRAPPGLGRSGEASKGFLLQSLILQLLGGWDEEENTKPVGKEEGYCWL